MPAPSPPPTIDDPPPAPSIDNPSTFAALADAFIAWFATFVTQVQAAIVAVYGYATSSYGAALATADDRAQTQADRTAVATSRDEAQAAATAAAGSAGQAAGFSATSMTELAISTGLKTLNVGAGKRFADALFVSIKDSAAPATNWMHGAVVSYEGALLTVSVTSTGGAGTKSSWQVASSGPQGPSMSSGSLTGAINERRATVASHATTADIWAATGNVIEFTGAANVTAFPAAPQAGASRQLVCAAGITFTPSVNLLVPGGQPYTTIANDRVRVLAFTTTQFILAIDYANGPPASGGEVGDIMFTERAPSSKYLSARQVVLAQASYPALYSQVGLRGNNLAAGFGTSYGRAGSTVYYDKAALGKDGYGYFYFFSGSYILYGTNGATYETSYFGSSSESVVDIGFKADGSLVILTRNYSTSTATIYTAPAGSPASPTYRTSPGAQNTDVSGRIMRVNGVFICVVVASGSGGAYNFSITTSTDGDSWTARSTSGLTTSNNYSRPFIWYYGGTYYIAIGSDIFSSSNLAAWTKSAAPTYFSNQVVLYGDAVFIRSGNFLYRVSADLTGTVSAVNVANNPTGASLVDFVVLFNEVYFVGVISGQDALYLVKYDAKSLRYIGTTRTPDGGGGTPVSPVLVASETDNVIYAVFYNGSPRGAQHTPISYNRATQFALPDYGALTLPAYIKVLP